MGDNFEGRWSVDGSQGGGDQAGVGVFMQQDQGETKVYVKKVVAGGSAARSGRVEVGDVITRVDGQDVEGQPVSALRRLIVGTQGTYVRLGFRRNDKFDFEVNLMRGTPDYLATLSVPRASEVLYAPPPAPQQFHQSFSAELEVSCLEMDMAFPCVASTMSGRWHCFCSFCFVCTWRFFCSCFFGGCREWHSLLLCWLLLQRAVRLTAVLFSSAH